MIQYFPVHFPDQSSAVIAKTNPDSDDGTGEPHKPAVVWSPSSNHVVDSSVGEVLQDFVGRFAEEMSRVQHTTATITKL